MAITYLSGERIQGHSNPNNIVEGYGTEQINTDFSSSTGWTKVGTKWLVDASTDNRVESLSYSSYAPNDYVYHDMGASFHACDQSFILRYKILIVGAGGYIQVGFTDNTTDGNSGDSLNAGLNSYGSAYGYTRIYDTVNGTFHEVETASTTTPSGMYNTAIWMEFAFNSTTNVATVKCFSDSGFTTPLNAGTQNLSHTLTMSDYQGLRYLFIGSIDASGRTLDSNCYVDDLTLHTGSTTIVSDKSTLTTATDSLGSTGDATNNGATLDTSTTVPSGLGTNCLNFDGSNDYLDCSSIMPSGTAMSTTGTVSFWFRPDAVSGDYLWSIGDTNGTAGRIYFEQQSSNKWVVTCNNGSGSLWKVDSTVETFSANTWYHIVVTHSGGSSYGAVKLYINGVDRTTNSNNGTDWGNWMFSGSDNMWFGGHSHDNNTSYGKADGKYKDIAIWNTALPFGTDEDTAGSVKWLYNTGTGRTADTISSGLRAYYKCDSATTTNEAPATNSNLPTGTRFEETDTRKIYRIKNGGWVEKGTA